MTLTLHPPLVCSPTGQASLQYGPEKVDDYHEGDDDNNEPVKSFVYIWT